MLGTLQNEEKSGWRDHVRPLVHAYNCTRNEVTGFTPYELMFGCQPRLPVDLAFKLPVRESQYSSQSEYVRNLKSRLQESYKVAMEKAAKIAHKNNTRYNRHVTASDLQPGDRVLVRNVRIRGKHKISDKWEAIIHVVVRRAGTLPVYTVRPESSDGPLRTLHRDLLLPCGYIPVEKSDEPVQKPRPRRPGTDDNLPDIDNHTNFDNLPDVFNSTLDGPLTFIESNSNQSDTEYLPDDGVTTTEQAVETALIQNHSPEDDHSDVREEQISVPSVNSDKDEEGGGLKGAEPEERMEDTGPMEGKDGEMDTEVDMDTNNSVRRSERNRQPPKQLDYTELGNPLITAVKSFFQGLSTAWAEVISEEPVHPPTLSPRIIIL